MPIIDLDMSYLGASYFIEKIAKGEINENLVVVSPDTFGVTRAKKFKEILEIYGINSTFGFIADFIDNNKLNNRYYLIIKCLYRR